MADKFVAKGELRDALFKACNNYIETAFEIMTPKIQDILYKKAKEPIEKFYSDYTPGQKMSAESKKRHKPYERKYNLKKAAPRSANDIKVQNSTRGDNHVRTFTAEYSPKHMQEVYTNIRKEPFPKVAVFNQAIGGIDAQESLHGGKFLTPFIFGNTKATGGLYTIKTNSGENNRRYGKREKGVDRSNKYTTRGGISGTLNYLPRSHVAQDLKESNARLNSSERDEMVTGGFSSFGVIHRAISQACNDQRAIQVLIKDITQVYVNYMEGLIKNG